MYLNQQLCQTDTITYTYTIERKGTLAKGRNGCNQPFAVINFEGLEKELIFNCNISEDFHKYSKIRLTYSKGLFGYNVIKESTLLE